MVGLIRRKSKENTFCKLFQVIFLLYTLCLNTVKCEENLAVLHQCCPGGSKYDFVTDRCTELPVTSDDETDMSSTYINRNADISKEPYFFSGMDYSESDLLPPKYITLSKQFVKAHFSSRNQTAFRFRLDHDLPTSACKGGHFMAVLDLTKEVSKEFTDSKFNRTTGGPPPPQTPIQFTPQGQLKISNEYYSSPEFCIAEFKKNEITVRVCNATCSEVTPCITKCCDLDEVWDLKHKMPRVRQGCIPTGENTWEPELYKYPTVKATPEERRATFPHYKIIHPRVFCRGRPIAQSIEQNENGRIYWKFRVSTKGKLFRRSSRYTWTDESDDAHYCLDGAVNSAFLFGKNQTEYSGLRKDEFLLRCSTKFNAPSRDQSALYASFMILSCFVLLLTITIHVAIYEKQSNRVWTLTLLSYSISLFYFNLGFAIMHISGFYIQRNNKINYLCYNIGVCVHFFLLSTFCWMSAVNYDIYSTFKVLKPTIGKSKGLRKYFFYLAFSLTVPTVIVTVGIVVDNIYRFDFESGIIIPEYGKRKCNMDPEYAQFVYAYGPAGLLLVFNIICFIITIYKMYMIQKSTKFATSSSSKKDTQKKSLTLFAKLLFVMGVPWILEIISWYTEKDKASGNSWYWAATDLLNICQSIAIFWIFICKPEVIQQLEQKYPWFQRFLDRVTLDTETAQRINERYPKLKRLIKLVTRKSKGTTTSSISTGKDGGQTDSTAASENPPENTEIRATSTERTTHVRSKRFSLFWSDPYSDPIWSEGWTKFWSNHRTRSYEPDLDFSGTKETYSRRGSDQSL